LEEVCTLFFLFVDLQNVHVTEKPSERSDGQKSTVGNKIKGLSISKERFVHYR
jgi:hypothetical protein